MALIDALRDDALDAAAAHELLERAAAATPRETCLAIIRDETLPQLARRLAIRRVLEAEARPGATVAELGALAAADAWLLPAHVRQVSVVNGKLPVQWLAEDLVIAIDVCPAVPGDGDRHRLVVYLRIAGQPEVDEIALGLRGGAGGRHEVREIGFAESETARPSPGPAAAPRPPVLGGLLMCRRALCDAQTGMHTLVDVIVEIPVQLPGPAMFDIYLQLRRITGPATLAVDVIGPGDADDGDEVVLTTGTLSLGAREGSSGPPPPALGIAIPNVVAPFERAGEHRLRVRCGAEVLGEHRFQIVDEGVA